ncbi:MAG: hypothetical protein KKB37_16645, partial [Alphaproteobacteria bacterium]|nr:hypothetical protein [Alphaproteobacteria bacterium]
FGTPMAMPGFGWSLGSPFNSIVLQLLCLAGGLGLTMLFAADDNGAVNAKPSPDDRQPAAPSDTVAIQPLEMVDQSVGSETGLSAMDRAMEAAIARHAAAAKVAALQEAAEPLREAGNAPVFGRRRRSVAG